MWASSLFSHFTRNRKVRVLLGLCALAVAAAWLFRLGFAQFPFVIYQQRTALGGEWYLIDETRPLGHANSRARIIRQVGPIVRTVAEEVGEFKVLKDDCLLFETASQEAHVQFVCGRGRPRTLYSGDGRPRFEADRLVVESLVRGQVQTVLTIPYSELAGEYPGD